MDEFNNIPVQICKTLTILLRYFEVIYSHYWARKNIVHSAASLAAVVDNDYQCQLAGDSLLVKSIPLKTSLA